MTDFAKLRTMMVDTQVRPSDVTKFPIIEAMLNTAREAFVPDDKRDLSYADMQISLGGERVMLDSRNFAKMLDAVNIQPTELVMIIGAGTGYGSAIAAHLGQAVVAVEEDEGLARDAEAALAQQGIDNAIVTTAPLTKGDAGHGPYDVILIEGGVCEIPAGLAAQLKEGGRAVAVFMDGSLGVARLGVKSGDILSWSDVFNATAPVLPGFAKKPSFAL